MPKLLSAIFLLWPVFFLYSSGSWIPDKIQMGYIAQDLHMEEGVAALELAVSQLKAKSILPDNLEIEFVVDSGCSLHTGPGAAVELFKEHNVSALIGLACTSGTEPSGKLAAFWNIPIISHIASGEGLRNKKTYPTLARTTVVSKSEAGFAVAYAIKEFGWKRVGVIQGPDRHANLLAHGIRAGLAFYGINISIDFHIKDKKNLHNKTTACLKEMANHARIIIPIYGIKPWSSQPVIMAAQALGMVGPNFVYVTGASSMSQGFMEWESKDFSETESQNSRAAFKQALVIHHDAFDLDRIQLFKAKLNKCLHKTLNTTSMYVSQLHDAMYLYGIALNRSFAAGVSYRNGKSMHKFMRRCQFIGESGNVTTDNNADRMPQFYIYGFSKEMKWTRLIAIDREYDSASTEYERFGVELHKPHWEFGLPLDAPICGFNNEFCPPDHTVFYIAGGAVALIAIVGLVVGIKWHQKRKLEEALFQMAWKIDKSQLVKLNHAQKLSLRSMSSVQSLNSGLAGSTSDKMDSFGFYMGSPIQIQKIIKKNAIKFERDHLIHLKSDVLANEGIKLDFEFKMSFLSDVIKGLEYLHRSPVSCHGRLTTESCLLDCRMVVQLSQFGVSTLFADPRLRNAVAPAEFNYHMFYHMAPEILKESCMPENTGGLMGFYLGASPQADIFSLGIVMYQVLFRREPYELDETLYQGEILDGLLSEESGNMRPKVPKFMETKDSNNELVGAMEACWADNPCSRPSLALVKTRINRFLKSFPGDIVEHMMKLMEKYTNSLEDMVEERTNQLEQQKERADNLISAMLPKFVADSLKAGQYVEPEFYEWASIYFSDIVGFTEMSTQSTPMEIVDLLNQLYSTFDKIIANFDAYKVETIGDAYMVASGIPERNGDKHITEIADMALSIRQAAKSFGIPHLPMWDLEIRIGIHTGSVVGGVVGLTMPRYCLFGDTVNTASRMESTSSAMKIQVSETTCEFLRDTGKYLLSDRGSVEIKGKGLCRTFWLVAKKF